MPRKLLPTKIKSSRQRLSNWIKGNAYKTRKEGTFKEIQVYHLRAGGKIGDEIARYDLPLGEDRGPDWEEDLTRQILADLESESNELGGMQQFACYSIFSEAEDGVNRCLLRVMGESEEDEDDEILSEGPNSKGLAQQAMRHQEANARIMTGGIMSVLHTMQRQNDKLMDMNQTLMASQAKHIQDMTEMWEERRQAALATQIEEVKAHGMKEGISLLKQIGPVVVNQMVGKDLLPTDTKAGVTSMARSFYGSLTEEQIAALQKVLRQDQMIHFMTMGETLVSDEDSGKEE